MMLSTALNMMIDKAECLFFLNTPNSISTEETISNTKSQWIYTEITMSNLIRKKDLSEYRPGGTRMFSKAERIGPNESFEYEIDLTQLTSIDRNDLVDWQAKYIENKTKYPLDILYNQHSNIIHG